MTAWHQLGDHTIRLDHVSDVHCERVVGRVVICVELVGGQTIHVDGTEEDRLRLLAALLPGRQGDWQDGFAEGRKAAARYVESLPKRWSLEPAVGAVVNNIAVSVEHGDWTERVK